MATIDFVNQLKALGFETQEPLPDKVCFEYIIEIGKNKGKKVFMGFENLNDFPMNAPHGPHFKPIDDEWANPSGGVHASNFGAGWVHWSRPFNEWNKTKRTVREYLAHIRNIMMTV